MRIAAPARLRGALFALAKHIRDRMFEIGNVGRVEDHAGGGPTNVDDGLMRIVPARATGGLTWAG